MATLTYDNINERWVLEETVIAASTVTQLLATENKFLDKNIAVKVITPAAGAATLTVADNSGNVTIGDASGGKYSLSASITGQMTFATAGWITTAGQSAADSSVIVGTIDQSILKNGETTIASGSNIIPSNVDQTINITAGYEGARTLIVKAMSSGATAAVTVAGTTQATVPTLANTTTTQSNKVQVNISPATTALTVDKYFIAVTPTAPATTVNLTKTITTAGYLSSDTQITASAATTANSQLYYIPLTTGSVSTTINSTTITPTLASSTASLTGKTRVSATPTQNTNNVGDFYIAVTATAPATEVTMTSTTTSGYITSDEVSTVSANTTQGTNTYYIPLTSGTKSAGAGSVSASSTTMTITEEVSQPSSGYYFAAVGSGTSNIGAGWYNAATTQTSNSATKYYSIPAATFTVAGNSVIASTGGYIDAQTEVGAVTTGTLSTGLTNKSSQGYNTLSDSSVVIPTDEQGNGGYLYIAPGYYGATQISLGTLIPDNPSDDAVSANILSGYEAFTTDGKRLVGSIGTYDGTYTTL